MLFLFWRIPSFDLGSQRKMLVTNSIEDDLVNMFALNISQYLKYCHLISVYFLFVTEKAKRLPISVQLAQDTTVFYAYFDTDTVPSEGHFRTFWSLHSSQSYRPEFSNESSSSHPKLTSLFSWIFRVSHLSLLSGFEIPVWSVIGLCLSSVSFWYQMGTSRLSQYVYVLCVYVVVAVVIKKRMFPSWPRLSAIRTGL